MNGKRIGFGIAVLAALACSNTVWGARAATAQPQEQPLMCSYRTMPPSDPKPDDPKKPKRGGTAELFYTRDL